MDNRWWTCPWLVIKRERKNYESVVEAKQFMEWLSMDYHSNTPYNQAERMNTLYPPKALPRRTMIYTPVDYNLDEYFNAND